MILSNSAISNGFGMYSNAPSSLALIAVISVFCALITIIGISALIFLIFGISSKAFASGITTSVIIKSAKFC